MKNRKEGVAFDALFQSGLIWNAAGEQEDLSQKKIKRAHSLTAPFGIQEIDQELAGGGLPFSAIHEWVNENEETQSLSIVSLLIRNAFQKIIAQKEHWNRFFVWIGEESWPTPFFLGQIFSKELHTQILRSSLFLRPKSNEDRLWTIDCALRSPASFSVVAFVPELTLAQSKRFSLALQKHPEQERIALFLRPKAQQNTARSRWKLTPIPSSGDFPRWRLELIHQKGQQARTRCWEIELSDTQVWNDETLSLCLSPEMVNRSYSVERKAS